MPYKRRAAASRRRTTGRRITKKSVRRIAKTEIIRMAETKEYVYTYSSVGSPAVSFNSVSYGSGAIATQLVGGLAKGTSANNRIGERIMVTGLYINLALQPGDNTNYLRLIILKPKRGAVFLANAPSTVTTANFVVNVLSQAASGSTQWANPVDTDRWRVLFDKQLTLSFHPLDGSSATTLPQMRFIRKFIKMRYNVQWDEGDNVTNDLFALAISDSPIAPNPGAVAGFFKIFFKDF